MTRFRGDLLWLFPLVTLSCRCQPQQVHAAEGLGVAPWGVDFGTVLTGTTLDRRFPIFNDGNAPFVVLSESLQGDEAFEASALEGTPVPSGGSLSVLARFSPNRDGPHRAVVTYTTDAPQSPQIEVVLEGVSTSQAGGDAGPGGGDAGGPGTPASCAGLSAVPASIAFGTVPLQGHAARPLIVTNQGDEPCTLLSAEAVSDGPAQEFSVTSAPSWPALLGPSQSISLGAGFSPTSATPPLDRQGTLTIQTADAAHQAITVDLRGRVQNPAYSQSAWPKWHADNANTGLSFVDTSGNRGQVAWTQPIGAPRAGLDALATVLQSPVVGFDPISSHDLIYQLGTDGRLLAMDGPSGALLWSTALTPPAALAQESTPTLLADGSIFVSTGGEQFGALQFFHLGADGSILWSEVKDDGFDTCPGLGLDGTLYLFDDDTPGVEAFSTLPGAAAPAPLWAATAGQPADGDGDPRAHVESFSAALTDQGQSLFTWGGFALSFSSAGQEIWYQQLGGGGLTVGWGTPDAACENDSKGAPAVSGTMAAVAFGGFDVSCSMLIGGLAGLDLATGAILWTAGFPDSPATALPFDYVTRTGSALLGYSSPALLGDGGFVLGHLDGVYAFDPPPAGQASATLRWRFPAGLILSSPAVGADGTVYVGSSDGNLYALEGRTGQLRWQFNAGAAINSSPAIGSDGTIYFAADSGLLYALR